MTEALLLTCPKCGNRVKVREGEDFGRCEACNGLVSRTLLLGASPPPTEAPLSLGLVLTGAFVLIAVGAFAMISMRPRHPNIVGTTSADPIYVPPPEATAVVAPAGELAWEPEARAPLLLSTHRPEGDDFFGFFRVWDGRSAWVSYGGLFDGSKLATRWRTEAIDPQILKREGVVPLASIVGTRVVVSDTSPILRVYDLENGNKQATVRVADAVVDICKPKDTSAPARIWVHVANEQNAVLELESGKATFAARPGWCAAPRAQAGVAPSTPAGSKRVGSLGPCYDDFRNSLAEATCLPAEAGPAVATGVEARYVIKDGASAVALGLKDARPIAVGIGPGFKVSWTTPLVADDTKPLPEAPHIAELADGKLYAVYGKVYFDSRVVALDAESGNRIWDVPLVGSVGGGSLADTGRGVARGLVASKTRVYVSRSGGELDVFDAADGKALGTIGKK
jgi:hypothetical protein